MNADYERLRNKAIGVFLERYNDAQRTNKKGTVLRAERKHIEAGIGDLDDWRNMAEDWLVSSIYEGYKNKYVYIDFERLIYEGFPGDRDDVEYFILDFNTEVDNLFSLNNRDFEKHSRFNHYQYNCCFFYCDFNNVDFEIEHENNKV